ncbi:MAG: peptide ABC transporter substrate-binding protein [bacterium]|nr:peptide ABC transporter substrate-binding protein [bacterium]
MSPKQKHHPLPPAGDPPAGNSPGESPAKRLPRWRTLRRLTRRQWLYLPRLFSRRERLRLIALAVVALLAFLVFTGRIVTRVTIERPDTGGLLREGAVGEPRFVNPLYASNDSERDLTHIVFSGLVRYDGNGHPAMDLAEAVDVSPDGKSYTARLRPGLVWHDGETLTADDIVFTIKTIQDPEYKSPLRQNWQGVAVEKLNESTVRFSLRQPYSPFIENLAVGILPEHLWRKIPRESAILSDLNLKPVGSGPYQFKKFTRLGDGTITSITLERNRNYHLAGPYLEEVRFSFYPDESLLIAAYRHNDIDGFTFLSAARLEELRRLDATIHELKLPKIFGVFLNSSVEPALGRKAVRQALALAIDRPTLIASTVAGGGVAVNAAIPPGTAGANQNIPATPFDPDRARGLLAADGWKDADHDGVLERTEGTGQKRKTTKLELRIATSDAPELASAANLIAGMWQAIGVKAEPKPLPIADLEANMIRPRAYEVLIFGEVFGHDPDPFAFWHTSQLKDPGLNIALYSNRTVDQLLEEARRTSDQAAREEKYGRFQKIVSDEIGAIFLYRPTNYYAIRRGFRGIDLDAITLPEERFNEINLWYVDTRRAFK